jgi:uncharacterized damage-inducible protein DinB
MTAQSSSADAGTLLHPHLHYHRWASLTLLQTVTPLPPELLTLDRATAFKTIPQTLLHIYQSDQVWFSRLNGQQLDLTKLSKNDDLGTFAPEWSDLLDRYAAWADALPSEQWAAEIQYRRSDGTEYSSSIWQIILHVVNHGSSHRAQLASMLRQSGITPPNLDLINYYRTLNSAA